MIKISVTITDKKENNNCNVKISLPKKLDNCTENEKGVAGAVYNTICDALKNIQ